MTRTQVLILIVLGIAIVAVFAGALFLLSQSGTQRVEVSTLELATVPPDPLLVTRVPICRQEVGMALVERGLPGEVALDPKDAVLEIRLYAAMLAGSDELPAGEIWGAFEAALAGQAEGCSGYSVLVVLVSGYRAQVAVEDLLAWESGSINDSTMSGRVELTK